MTVTPADIKQIRQVFNQAIESETDPDRIDKIELIREFYTNPGFCEWLTDYVYTLIMEAK